jgi:hypothetical protein
MFKVNFVQQNGQDERYNLLTRFAASGRFGSDGLKTELADDRKWTAYTVTLKNPSTRTPIPITTIYDRDHHTRLFLFRPSAAAKDPAVALVNGAAGPLPTQDKFLPLDPNLTPLISVPIVPHAPKGPFGTTEVGLEIFYDGKHVCWSNQA